MFFFVFFSVAEFRLSNDETLKSTAAVFTCGVVRFSGDVNVAHRRNTSVFLCIACSDR